MGRRRGGLEWCFRSCCLRVQAIGLEDLTVWVSRLLLTAPGILCVLSPPTVVDYLLCVPSFVCSGLRDCDQIVDKR